MPKKSNYEVVQSLPVYYEEYAHNALFASQIIWEKMESANEIDITFSSRLVNVSKSLDEAFRREASFALELIIKSAIGYRLINDLLDPKMRKISSSHDITLLWKQSELAPLDTHNKRRLIIATQVLYWSGRYGEAVHNSTALKISENTYKYKDRKLGDRYVLVDSFSYTDVKNIFDIVVEQIEKIKQS